MSVRRPPAGYGEDNDYVYKQIIGMSDDEVAELTKKEVIGIVNEECPYPWAGPKPDYPPKKK